MLLGIKEFSNHNFVYYSSIIDATFWMSLAINIYHLWQISSKNVPTLGVNALQSNYVKPNKNMFTFFLVELLCLKISVTTQVF